MKKKQLLVSSFGLLLVMLLGLGSVVPVEAQDPYLPNPNGWGPPNIYILGQVDAENDPEGSYIFVDWNDDYPCDEALVFYLDTMYFYWAGVDIKIPHSIPTSDLRVRFVTTDAGSPLSGFQRISLETYTEDYTLVGQTERWWTEAPYIEGYPELTQMWDFVISADTEPGGILRIRPRGSYSGGPAVVILSGLYVNDNSYEFPELCGQVAPTRTPTPLPTATGTITATLAPTVTPHPTGTPTFTPVPYVTWTPAPSPTPWQSPMPTLYPTPAVTDVLPTWAPWPTVAWPTVETVTPYPTHPWEDLTTTPVATSTPFTPTLPYGQVITRTMELAGGINATQVYSAVQDLTATITYPIRVLRGTVKVYLGGLGFLVDAILLMLFWIGAVLAIRVILGVIGAVVKLIEVIMEFIPL